MESLLATAASSESANQQCLWSSKLPGGILCILVCSKMAAMIACILQLLPMSAFLMLSTCEQRQQKKPDILLIGPQGCSLFESLKEQTHACAALPTYKGVRRTTALSFFCYTSTAP